VKKSGTDLSAVRQVPEKTIAATQARLSVPDFFTTLSKAAIASYRPHSHIAIPMRRPSIFVAVSGNTNSRPPGVLPFHLAAISPRDLVKWYLQFEPMKVARLVPVGSNRSYSRGTVEVLDRQCLPRRPFP
jgi:hypothetical protein